MICLIGGCIMGLTVGGCIATVIYCNSETIMGKIAGIIIPIVLTSAVFTLIFEGESSAWNGGYCPDCEVHWQLGGVARSMGGHTKYYFCPQCYREITQ